MVEYVNGLTQVVQGLLNEQTRPVPVTLQDGRGTEALSNTGLEDCKHEADTQCRIVLRGGIKKSEVNRNLCPQIKGEEN